ncbi:MAG: hypothetical protein ACREQJ_13525 [Candidatus Binatia bacterium]
MKRTLAVLGACLVAASVAQASQFRRFDRATQVAGSDVILVGRVSDMRSRWSDDRSVILTDNEIFVDDVWKGDVAGNRVVVETLGGAVDDIELKVDGSPAFAVGERVVLFLTSRGDSFTPWGMKFGKLAVEGDGDGAFVLGSLPTAVEGIGAASEQVSLSLAELRGEVGRALEAH